MIELSGREREQIRTMDRFLATLDPKYVEKLFEQLRIMGVLKDGSAGDPGTMSYEVFSTLVQRIEDQDSVIVQMKLDIQELKNDIAAAARMIHSLIPADPRAAASTEYSFFSKHGLYLT